MPYFYIVLIHLLRWVFRF